MNPDGTNLTDREIPAYTGPWFDSPFFPHLQERSGLSPDELDEVQRFARDGYLVLERDQLGLDDFDSVAERILSDTKRLYRGAGRVGDAWVVSEAVRELALAPGVITTLERLYQREAVPFQTLNFERGTQQPTHSDAFHFHCLPKFFMCGVWVALEDVDADNGPVFYYPESHRLPDIDVLDLGVPAVGNRDTAPVEKPYTRFVERMVAESELPRERFTAAKGQALIWAANLYHGGDRVGDPARTRHSQVTHCYFKGCVYYSPQRSDPARGKLAIQRVRNIRTGNFEPLRYGERRVRPSITDRMRWYAPTVMQKLKLWRKDSRRF